MNYMKRQTETKSTQHFKHGKAPKFVQNPSPSTPFHRHTIRIPHLQKQLNITILDHIQHPFSCRVRGFPLKRDGLRTIVAEQSGHGRYEFHLCELPAGTVPRAFGPCDKRSLVGGQETFLGEAGAKGITYAVGG